MDAREIVHTLDDVYFHQFHERDTITNLHLVVRDGDRIIDVGGSLGQYPFFLNRRFRGLSITCIEADGIRFRELERRCATWTTEGRNTITALNAAACDHNGVVDFYTTFSNVSGSIVDSDFAARFRELHDLTARGENGRTAPPSPTVAAVQVSAVTLDSLCQETTPELVKIDVEGAEYDAMLGATRLLQRGVTQFLVEVDKRANNRAMFQLFQRHGYRAIKFFNHTLFYHPHSGRPVPRHTVLVRRAWYKITRRFRPRAAPQVGTPTP